MPGEVTPPTPGPPAPAPPEPPWVAQFMQNQAKELEIRLKQVEIDATKEQHWFEYSQDSLRTQAVDRREERTHGTARFNRIIWLIGGGAVLVLAFLAIVILSGNPQVALELVKIVIYGGAGYLGGYGAAQRRKEVPPTPPVQG